MTNPVLTHIRDHAAQLIKRSGIPADSGLCVYRHLDANGDVLYVGYSANLAERTRGHGQAPWFFQIDRVTWSGGFADALEAHRAEIAEIRRLDPPCNVKYTTREPRYKRHLSPAEQLARQLDRAAESIRAGRPAFWSGAVHLMWRAVG